VIELPEAATLAAQSATALTGRTITAAEANHSPHAFTGFFGEPAHYPDMLVGQTITGARAWSGHVQIEADELRIVVTEGATPVLYSVGEKLPAKHQLRVDLDDGSSLVVSVAMYGGIQVFHDGENDNPYYALAMAKPSPLTDTFTSRYFADLLADDAASTLSAKAFLATQQRIPGLGNGVLHDIVWNARINPRRKVATLSDDERATLYASVTTTLAEMTAGGGRDTERTLFGHPGGYATVMSRKTLELPCPRCAGRRVKEAYMGGAVYYCPTCQPAR
jgi:formamidopyrimidine-DNA glycosylase